MLLTTIALFGLAFSLDLLVGEPPNALHPVAWFGRLVGALDREWAATERGQRLAGVGIAVLAPLCPTVAAGGAVALAGALSPLAGAVVAGVVLFLTTSLRSLLELTRAVVDATAAAATATATAGTDGTDARAEAGADDGLEAARERVRGLVGRDTSTLSAAEIRSAAVESVGENLADGLVATLLPFALLAPLSLPAAAAAAAWVKGVNTLDSMLGYPAKPHGTASARLDDLVMWLPARLAAVTIAVAGADPLALGRARKWARDPPSPNSGWPMATLACVLSVRLRKMGVYDLNPGADLPTVADGERAVTVVGRAAVVALVVAVLLAAGVTAVAPSGGGQPVPTDPTVGVGVALGAEAGALTNALAASMATLPGLEVIPT
ncbi:cobalamin biosynthesis protein CobD [Haloterrigena turkmenica DSM 5511]|uniref:Probable cobalamin biosynthesis protein CobD n=1 Tax=Haloterrigena turkmenica (strain ATCC 51198 / DSM 5511 / JCM 9101 / NCIMB 13204 / VKM B-1734 / 4k) TaxID=543526 RepID=D2RXI0_HALTV|nr:CobD/CbiB family cobalamin biosynthesis protein [Haloterrigena turkmenica]ADB61704.1 cobalamin biosynthesis protein CobD [Haloterrigena turkmenica DSM 5511]